jgi:hypothetical protein
MKGSIVGHLKVNLVPRATTVVVRLWPRSPSEAMRRLYHFQLIPNEDAYTPLLNNFDFYHLPLRDFMYILTRPSDHLTRLIPVHLTCR